MTSEAANDSVSDLLRQHTGAFTSADKKVLRALRDDYPRAGLESLPKLATRAGVSAPTVLRMLAKVGFDSYGDFQAALHDEVTARMSAPTSRQDDLAVDDQSVQARLAVLARGVNDTAEKVDPADFDAVVELLATGKRRVVTFGGFESEVCASHLANLLSQVRAGVRFQARGASGAIFEVLDVQRQTVVVAFDFRRYQTSTMNTVRRARERGASIVLFTDRWISPAADHADYVLVCNSKGVGRFDSRASCIALIEAIVADVTHRLGDEAERRIEAVYALLSGSTWAEELADPKVEPSEETDGEQERKKTKKSIKEDTK